MKILVFVLGSLALPQLSSASSYATLDGKVIPIPKQRPSLQNSTKDASGTEKSNAEKKVIPIPRQKPSLEQRTENKKISDPQGKSPSEAKESEPKETPKPKNDSRKKKLVLNGCINAVKGEFQFGEAGIACNVDAYESEESALKKYQSVIFDERKENEKSERTRYVSNLTKLISDSSDAYYKQRKPKASAQEIATFRRAFLALTHQESFLSHYRISEQDNDLKVMKGDHNHSFGLVQLHSKWHRDMVLKSKAWTLPGNIAYGLDLYYQAWQKAGKERCVKSLEQRARSAYSIYNAGPKKGCRWKNPRGDKYAHNDKNYFSKYRDQEWNAYINQTQASKMKTSGLVSCVLDDGGGCR